MVGESIRLFPVWPRFEFRSTPFGSVYFSVVLALVVVPCSAFVSPRAPAFPLHKITISSMKNSGRKKKNNVGLFCHKIIIYLFIYSQSI